MRNWVQVARSSSFFVAARFGNCTPSTPIFEIGDKSQQDAQQICVAVCETSGKNEWHFLIHGEHFGSPYLRFEIWESEQVLVHFLNGEIFFTSLVSAGVTNSFDLGELYVEDIRISPDQAILAIGTAQSLHIFSSVETEPRSLQDIAEDGVSIVRIDSSEVVVVCSRMDSVPSLMAININDRRLSRRLI